MQVVVELFGIPRERAGTARTLATGQCLGDVLAELASRFPGLAQSCIEGRQLRTGTRLQPGPGLDCRRMAAGACPRTVTCARPIARRELVEVIVLSEFVAVQRSGFYSFAASLTGWLFDQTVRNRVSCFLSSVSWCLNSGVPGCLSSQYRN